MGIDVQGSGLPVQLIPLDKVHHLLASDLNVRHGVTASVRGGGCSYSSTFLSMYGTSKSTVQRRSTV